MTPTPVRVGSSGAPATHAERAEPFASIALPALAAAARRTFVAFRNDTGDAVDRNEVHDVLAFVASRVVAATQRDPSPTTDAPVPQAAASALGRRLLELLRSEVIRAWGVSPAPAADMLALLRAFEHVQATLEPDWSDYFASRLSGPGALDLVVEVAHDLRSPLTSILFLAETLQRGQSGEVNDIQRRQLGLIYGAALGLSSVASDVTELARGGDRLVDRERAPFSVTEIFESVRDIVHPIAEEKGLDVTIDPPESDHRLGHPLALSRVLLNLTTNALKFTDQGRVEIVAKAKGLREVEFSVRDTGRGISDEALETLYQPFRRTRARKEYCFSGTGLGLAMCKKLVNAMGAELLVETRAGWGTRFHFTLELPGATHL